MINDPTTLKTQATEIKNNTIVLNNDNSNTILINNNIYDFAFFKNGYGIGYNSAQNGYIEDNEKNVDIIGYIPETTILNSSPFLTTNQYILTNYEKHIDINKLDYMNTYF